MYTATTTAAATQATASSQIDVSLAHRALFSLADAAGAQITCREGSVWLTLDDDARDVILHPGQTFSTTEHRRALVYALEASSIRVASAMVAAPAAQARQRTQNPATRLCVELPAGMAAA